MMGILGLYLVNTVDCKPIYYFTDGRIFKGCAKESQSRYKIKPHEFLDQYYVEDMHTGILTRLPEHNLIDNLGVEIE